MDLVSIAKIVQQDTGVTSIEQDGHATYQDTWGYFGSEDNGQSFRQIGIICDQDVSHILAQPITDSRFVRLFVRHHHY